MRGVIAISCAFALATNGCTFIGMGIGASTDKMTTVPKRGFNRPENLAVGNEVEIESKTAQSVKGKYLGVHAHKVAVQTEHGTAEVQVQDIREIQSNRGSYWLEGAGVGLAADVAFWTIVAITHPYRVSDAPQ